MILPLKVTIGAIRSQIYEAGENMLVHAHVLYR